MKKTILLLGASLFLVCTMFAQPYESIFGDSTTQWNVAISYSENSTIYFMSHGETLTIKDKEYTNIGENRYISEDTTTGKVWIYFQKYDVEFLTMDLTLSVGDTFHLSSWHTKSYAIIDSIYFDDGRKIQRTNYQLNTPTIEPDHDKMYTLKFIEGIGPNAGLALQVPFGSSNYLLCSYKDGELIFQNKEMGGLCEYQTVFIEERSKSSLKIITKNDRWIIQLSEPISYQYLLYNINGVMLKEGRTDNKINNEISNADLNNGLYILLLRTKKDIHSIKLIKQK